MELIVGCVTKMPEGYTDRHFIIEVFGEKIDEDDNSSDEDFNSLNLYYLKEDIQGMTPEIVDEITFVMDHVGGSVIYSNDEAIVEAMNGLIV